MRLRTGAGDGHGSMRHCRHTGTSWTERRARGVGTFEGPGSGDDAVSWEKELSGAAEYLGCGHSLPVGCEALMGKVGGTAKPRPLPRARSAALELMSAGRLLGDHCMGCPLSGTRIPSLLPNNGQSSSPT